MADHKDEDSLSNEVEGLTVQDKRKPVSFSVQLSSHGCVEVSVKGQHVSVERLRDEIEKDKTIMQQVKQKTIIKEFTSKQEEDFTANDHPGKPKILDYLLRSDLPKFPTPVEFHISHVCHATTDEPARSIVECSQEFQGGVHKDKKFSWWSLQIDDKEIIAAGRRYMEKHKQMELPEDFLTKFTTSPVFQPESRYGNYRFTFPLKELMEMYKEQFCGGKEPVLSVFETRFYKQEIMYAVLVHSPKDKRNLEGIDKSDFVSYQDGKIIWKAQAICDHITHELDGNEVRELPKNSKGLTKYFNVWDHVCLAFCLTDNKSLEVPREKLIEAVKACKIAEINHVKDAKTENDRDRLFKKAEVQVKIWKTEPQEN